MSIEAMKLALEALENTQTFMRLSDPQYVREYNATVSLRQAIAEAEKQKPAAWITADGEGFRLRFSPPTNDVPLGWDALYLHPQPKREWVGLTDDKELWEMWVESPSDVLRFAHAIEAKLREKNGC